MVNPGAVPLKASTANAKPNGIRRKKRPEKMDG
jgi:hypothetical protein